MNRHGLAKVRAVGLIVAIAIFAVGWSAEFIDPFPRLLYEHGFEGPRAVGQLMHVGLTLIFALLVTYQGRPRWYAIAGLAYLAGLNVGESAHAMDAVKMGDANPLEVMYFFLLLFEPLLYMSAIAMAAVKAWSGLRERVPPAGDVEGA